VDLALVRHHLARHHRWRRPVAALLAVTTGLGVALTVARIDTARRDWGEPRTVLVARRTLDPGALLGPDDVTLTAWPAPLVPPGALTAIDPDARLVQRVGPGEVVTHDDVGAVPGARGLIPAGWRAFAVPFATDTRPPLDVGDPVGLVVAGSPLADGLVVAVDDITVTVATPAQHAPAAADAVLLGSLALVLIGPAA
jgi:hypothetical protein